MSFEIKVNDELLQLEMISRDGNMARVRIEDREYELDIFRPEEGVYSILLNGKSYNVELVPGKSAKQYTVNTYYNSMELEIIDAEAKYQQSRRKDDSEDANQISSPMPGKVVKVLVDAGDSVKAGDTVIIVSAMKMESEYKVKQDRVIKEVLVKEGDTVDAHQPLVIIE